MKDLIVSVSVVSVFLLAGCGSTMTDSHTFFHPIVTPQRMQVDRARCEIYARANARTSGGGSVVLHAIMLQGQIESLTETCMRAKGYKVIEKSKVPEQKPKDRVSF